MKLTGRQINSFQNKIFTWWEVNKRDLPWRHTHDPYKILVSEVMLQQTQVLRVLAKYTEFIEVYPSVDSLARASTAGVLKIWKGMGYNRRALYLKKTAEIIVREYNGEFPKSEKELMKLPGLGTYTTRAILVFAYKKDIAAVDTNVRKIFTHFFFNGVNQKEKDIQLVADTLVPHGQSWEWHQALMDYGALEMKNIKTKTKKTKSTIPFRETNRFYRGRIMDVLREHDIREFVLIKEFMETYDKPEDYIVNILEGLLKDGLIERKKDILSLPQ